SGADLREDRQTEVELDGYFRGRGELLNNLDLDRGPTPSGRHLYPLPTARPDRPWLTHGDMRLRTDVSMYPKNTQIGVHLRLDVVDNLPFGSTPRGTPLTTTAQRPVDSPHALRVKRAYARALTPVGVFAVGRMGADWGLGLLANSGSCPECDYGDAADRIAWMAPIADHIWGLAFDVAYRGPTVSRRSPYRDLDLDPSDNVRTVTAAVAKYRRKWVRERRRRAGRSTIDYGLYVSHRWQRNDTPTHYRYQTDEPPNSRQVMRRGFRATAVDGWFRWVHPVLRVELELAYIHGRIDEPSLTPGIRFDGALTSDQYGGALETEFGAPESRLTGGLDAGYASGDRAPGFGANPDDRPSPPSPGDLDGPQFAPPSDFAVNNFQFHPDYRIDRILFREIIGTVTDAAYLRPHGRWTFLKSGPSRLSAELAAPVSWAVQPASTPGGASPLGLELDPSLVYRNLRGFEVSLDYGVLFPVWMLEATDRRRARLTRFR
ncbi:MAG: TIGR04551 family protein, partial [Bradymonadaceae bacterium]